jgi:hypothetical protein
MRRVSGDDIELVCVDTWLGAREFWTWRLDPTISAESKEKRDLHLVNGYPSVYYTFLGNMKQLGLHDIVTPLPLPSNTAAQVLGDLGAVFDFIYVDASHEYEDVKADIRAYWKLLRKGGVMCGDDYCDFWSGVKRAVDEHVVETGLTADVDLDTTTWAVKK